MTDQDIETEIQAKGADVAPRVTLADIEAQIVAEHYFTAADGIEGAIAAETYSGREPHEHKDDGTLSRLTFCVLSLRNGFAVVGQASPATPESFSAKTGRAVARIHAIDQVAEWLRCEQEAAEAPE